MSTTTQPHTPQSTAPPNLKPTAQAPLVVREIPLSRIVPSLTNPRKTFDTPADKELVESIRTHGVMVPILVRDGWQKLGTKSDQKEYEIIAGERRFRAAKAALLPSIPCVIHELLSDTDVLEMQIIENLQREDVSAIEEGQGYRQLIASLAKSESKPVTHGQGVKRQDLVDQVAKKVGKSVRYVYARMKLTELAPDVVKALAEGRISPSHADEMVRLTPGDQVKALKKAVTTEYVGGKQVEVPVSVREFKEELSHGFTADLTRAPWKLDDADLLKAAGSCSGCLKRAGNSPLQAPGEKADTCMDTSCFAKKLTAFVTISVNGTFAKMKDASKGEDSLVESIKNRKAVYLTPDYSYAKTIGGLSAVPSYNVKSVAPGAPCKYARLAFSEKDKKAVLVCMDHECKKHFPGYASGHSYQTKPESPAQKAARELKDACDLSGKLALMLAIGDRAANAASQVLLAVVQELASNSDISDEAIRVISQHHGWPIPDRDNLAYDFLAKAVEKNAPKLSTAKLNVLAGQLLAGQLADRWSGSGNMTLDKLAKAFKVNAAKVVEKAHSDCKLKQKLLDKVDAKTAAAKCDEDGPTSKAKAKAKKAGRK